MSGELPPTAPSVRRPRLTEADRGKGGHRPKPRMQKGLHKNQWVKTCVALDPAVFLYSSAALIAAVTQLLHLPGTRVQMVGQQPKPPLQE